MGRDGALSLLRRVADWLLGIDPQEPDCVREKRLGTMFQKRPALAMSSLAILLVSATTARVTGAWWAFAWVASDMLLLAGRAAMSFRHDRPDRHPSLRAMRLIAFGSCALFILLGSGCSLAMATGIPMLMLMSAMSVMGLVIGITTLWAGVPRLAVAMISLTALPFAAAIAWGTAMPAVAVQFLILMAGGCAFVTQNNAKLLAMLHAEHRNRMLAATDQLTGLASRASLHEELLRRTQGEACFALLYLDLDGVKDVNDRYGHLAGDAMLAEQARRIAGAVGGHGIAARFGGDEFVLLIDGADRRMAGIIAQRLIGLVGTPVPVVQGGPASVGLSIGIALFPADGVRAEALVSRADRALYAAKKSGRGCYRFHDDIAAREDDASVADVAAIRLA